MNALHLKEKKINHFIIPKVVVSKEVRQSEKAKTIAVKIDNKTTIMIKSGDDPEMTRKHYLENHAIITSKR